jgi:hypothetical protein
VVAKSLAKVPLNNPVEALKVRPDPATDGEIEYDVMTPPVE